MVCKALPVFVGGPTASGKSRLCMELAERIHGEIISVDSMQVYRGLDIGTAKVSKSDQQRNPHHLIDIVDPGDLFNVGNFLTEAGKAMECIQLKGRVPIFCGGTGLYFKAFFEGLSDLPSGDITLRKELLKTPLRQLIEELHEKDPLSYRTIDLKNRRRVERAIEVIRLSGRPFSELKGQRKPGYVSGNTAPEAFLPEPVSFCITRERESLCERINSRVDEMFRLGLIEETENLLNNGVDSACTAMQALGYRQVIEYLKGLRSLPETIELVKSRTRQFSRRQKTWFQNQCSADWITLSEGFPSKDALDPIIRSYNQLMTHAVI